MKRSVALIAVVALVLVGGLAILLATRQPLTATPLQSPLLGKAAPAFRGHELSGGTFSHSHGRLDPRRLAAHPFPIPAASR